MTTKLESQDPSAAQWLRRALWFAGILLLIAVVGFAAYYYQDRYMHVNDPLVERQIRQMEEVVRENPSDPNARASIAEWYLRNGMVEEAIAQGKEALKLDANHKDALILLGQAYLAQENSEEAIIHFARVAELSKNNEFATIDPRMNLVYYNLGELYREQGDFDKAIEAFMAALTVDRTDADARYALGLTYQAMEDHESAIREFNETLRFVPNFTEVYWGLQVSYTALGMDTEAIYAEAMVNYTEANYQEAVEKLEQVVQDAPGFAAAYLGLGMTYEELGSTKEAIDAIHRYLETNPDSVIARHMLGRLTAKLSQTGGD